MRQFSFLIAALLVLPCGCAWQQDMARPTPEPAKAEVVAPIIPERFSISGGIGVLQGDEGWHGKMDWQQRQTDFSIKLLGPFGSEQAELRKTNDRLELRAPSGKSISGPKLALWEKQVFGETLPLSALPYWLHGHPCPTMADAQVKPGKGGVSEIRQDGWVVDYSEWRKMGGRSMPGKIVLVKHKVRIKLVVNEYSAG
jgi:outer membrane lipoprotein LolB